MVVPPTTHNQLMCLFLVASSIVRIVSQNRPKTCVLSRAHRKKHVKVILVVCDRQIAAAQQEPNISFDIVKHTYIYVDLLLPIIAEHHQILHMNYLMYSNDFQQNHQIKL